jgi:beta-lactamase regulating signal transducer with metallopeptidase domain
MTHIPEAAAWTLIHFCWQAVAIAAAYRLLAFALARRSAQTRYIAALALLILMLCFAVGTFAWQFRSEAAPASFTNSASHTAAPLAANFSRTTAPGTIATQLEPARLSLQALLPWIDGIWLLGVLALSIRSLGGWWYLRRLRLASIAEPPAAVQAAFQRISACLGLTRAVALRLSHAIDSPMTVGAMRAIVLLPLSAITSLGPDELEVVLAHELAHVRRADFFWNILQTIAETLFFFHPAVWWINSRIRHERELCCDDLALSVCPNPFTYASALYRLEEHRSHHLRLAMALDGHQSRRTLLMRISRILGEPMTRIPSRRFRPFSLAAAVAGLVVLLVPVPHVLAKLAPQQSASAPVTAEVRVPVTVNTQTNTALQTAAASTAPVSVAIEQAVRSAQTMKTQVASNLALSVVTATDGATSAPASQTDTQSAPKPSTQPHSDYIDRMKAAGYDVDLDKLIAMKIQDVTPEYAQAMSQAGFGKLSADDLIACKIQGVNPQTIAEMKKQGLEINSIHDAISFRIFQVTPEFISGMKAAGFEGLTSNQLIAMRVQGVTPEYARELKQKFPQVTADDLVKARIFRIDDEFIAQASKHGFNNLPFDKLVQLRISGLLDDESVKTETK